MTRLQEQHIRVPAKIFRLGDDLEFSAFLNPPLTTVQQPKGELGGKIFSDLVEIDTRRNMSKSHGFSKTDTSGEPQKC